MRELAAALWDVTSGQGLRQLAELALALVLSTLIGWERGAQQKSAGLRTHTLVGIASALMMQISQWGFGDVLDLDNVSFDPSRVAAQIISGIGFIGGGLIFVRRDAVRGLTTAATIWLTCAVGMACGGGLPLLAAMATGLHFLVVRGYPFVAARFSVDTVLVRTDVRLTYRTGQSLLPGLMEQATEKGFRIVRVRAERSPGRDGEDGVTAVFLRVEGPERTEPLVSRFFGTEGVLSVEVSGGPDRDE